MRVPFLHYVINTFHYDIISLQLQSLSKLKHANIVKVREIFREDNKLYFIFEYMKQNLYEMIKAR